MSATSSIEWTDATWNPVRGCSRVSQGCVNCYAESVAARFSGPGLPYEGLAQMTPSGPRWTGKVELVEKHLADPLHWKKPRRVFVNSMSDLFHESLPDEAVDRVFAAMTCAQRHTFQILTKRPERMVSYLSRDHGPVNVLARILNAARAMPKPRGWVAPESHGWPYRNVWLGVSVEDQATADERIPILLQTPAAVRFVSYEPALGPVDFTTHLGTAPNHDDLRGLLTWIIVGGESGPRARPFDIAWARSTVAACKAAGVACFVKQLGSKPIDTSMNIDWDRTAYSSHGKGGDWSEWSEDLRVREFPK